MLAKCPELESLEVAAAILFYLPALRTLHVDLDKPTSTSPIDCTEI